MFVGFKAFSIETLILPNASSPPKVDGVFDEKEWSEASCASGFISTKDEWASPQTSAYIELNGEFLYFAFQCRCFEIDKLAPTKHKKDSKKIFGDDSVEFFLTPEYEGKTYYHLAFNFAGSAYSAKCEEKRDEKWNPQLEIATGKTDKVWVIEGRISLKSINAKNEAGKKWKLNFCRNNGRGASSSWTGQHNFNLKELMGNAVIAEKALVDYSLESIQLQSGLRATLRNHQSKAAECKLELSYAGKKILRSFNLCPKECKRLPAIPLASAKNRDLGLKIFGDNFKYEKKAFLFFNKLFSILPNSYYYLPSQNKLAAKIGNHLDDGSTIKIRAYSSNSKKPLRQMELRASDSGFSMNIKGLSRGRYVLSAQLLNKNDAMIAEDDRVFFIKEKEECSSLSDKQDIKLDKSIIFMNGKPFFPFMISASPPESITSVFNVKYAKTGLRKNSPSRGACGVPTKLKRKPFTFRELPEDEKTKEAIAAYFKKPSGENHLYRCIEYEAQIPLRHPGKEFSKQLDNSEEYLKIYKCIKEISPQTLTSIQTDNLKKIKDFKNACDIIEAASYFSSYAKDPIRKLGADINSVRKEIGKKPLIWWLGASIPKPCLRDAEKIRAAAYLAAMKGVNGIIYHNGHGGVPASRTRLWSVFRELSKEMETIYPIIALGEKMPYKIQSKNKNINIVARKYERAIYIFALNTIPFTIEGKIILNQKKNAKAPVLFEEREAGIKEGCIEDEFTPYEPHIYKITQ